MAAYWVVFLYPHLHTQHLQVQICVVVCIRMHIIVLNVQFEYGGPPFETSLLGVSGYIWITAL